MQLHKPPWFVQRVFYTAPEAARVYLAGYDTTGQRLLSLQGTSVQAGSGALDFQRGEGVIFRVFLLGDGQRPVGMSLADEESR